VPPSRFNRHCPQSIDDVVMGALALSRDARWASAREMREAFEEVQVNFASTPAQVAAWKLALVPPVADDAPSDEATHRRFTPIDDLEISVVRSPDSLLRKPSEADIALADSLGLGAALPLVPPTDTLSDASIPGQVPEATEHDPAAYEEIHVSILRHASEPAADTDSGDDGPGSTTLSD
jgi:hypothetical protein